MVAVEKVATMVGGAVAAAVGMEMVGRMAEAMVDAMMEEVRVRGPPAAWTMEAGREAGQWAGQKVELESAALLGNQSQSPVLFSAFISHFFSAHPAGKDLIRQSSSQATKFVTDSCGQFLTLTPAAHGQHYIALTSVGRQLTSNTAAP